MKALLFNGSPRKGNTVAALNALKKGMENIGDMDIVQIDANEVSVSPCIACETCKDTGHCVFDDDTNNVIDEAVRSDIMVFATPVYWWGITSQLKLIIDKLYSQGKKLRGLKKKIGVIVIGESEQEDPQYQIISKQFECICNYLDWEIIFCKTYTAAGTDDLAGNTAAMKEIEGLWETAR